MVYQLNPRLLEREGLKIALSHRLDSVESRAGIVTHLDMPEILNLPAEVEESLYHIAQEALNNALKHSRESEVWITLTVGTDDRETVLLQIRDNGVGFSPANADPCGMGLENMRHRAEEQGGAFSLTSNPGEGTIIKVEIPLIT